MSKITHSLVTSSNSYSRAGGLTSFIAAFLPDRNISSHQFAHA